MTRSESVDWEVLRQAARDVAKRAYVPYSSYPAGAAALVDDGRIVVGCNVENDSLGLTLCAECGLISSLISSGGGRLVAFTCVGGQQPEIVTPCGRCRQLLWEHAGPSLEMETPMGVATLGELLPQAWGRNPSTE